VERGEAAARTTGATVLRGTAWSTVARVLPQVYALISSVAAARFLGPDGMGRQSFIAFAALSTSMLLSSGLSISLMRYVGEQLGRDRPETALDLVRWAWGLMAAAGALGGGFLVAIAASGADPTAAWVFAAVGAALGTLHSVPSSVLIGAQRWRDATIVGLTTATLGVPATIGVLAAGGGITGMFAVEALIVAANLIFTSMLARRAVRELRGPPEPDRRVRRAMVRYAGWSTISVLLSLIVFRRSEFFFLDVWSTDSEIALYSIAFAAINALTVGFDASAAALLPAVATLHGAGDLARIRSGYRRSLRLILLVALPVTAGVLAVGPDLVRLVYGHDYDGAGQVLRLMTIVLPVVPLMYVANALLVGLGSLWPMMVAGAGAAGVNVALAFALIPRFDAVGAALANAGAQLVVAIGTALYCWRVVGEPPVRIREALRLSVAAAVAGLAAWQLVELAPGVLGVLAGTIAGVAVFMFAGRLLGVLSREDAEWLIEATGGRAFSRAIAPACRFLSARAASG
jgi:O-antigen/teichoic acid export membrane protein